MDGAPGGGGLVGGDSPDDKKSCCQAATGGKHLFFRAFLNMWSICMGQLTAMAPLCFGTHQIEHIQSEESHRMDPKGKGSAVLQTPEILTACRGSAQI